MGCTGNGRLEGVGGERLGADGEGGRPGRRRAEREVGSRSEVGRQDWDPDAGHTPDICITGEVMDVLYVLYTFSDRF